MSHSLILIFIFALSLIGDIYWPIYLPVGKSKYNYMYMAYFAVRMLLSELYPDLCKVFYGSDFLRLMQAVYLLKSAYSLLKMFQDFAVDDWPYLHFSGVTGKYIFAISDYFLVVYFRGITTS